MICLTLLALLAGCNKDTPDTDATTDSSIDDTASTDDTTVPTDDTTVPTDDTSELVDDYPGLLRIGPPAPAVGIYGIAATEGRVFVSNLHVPFITVADSATGEWVDSLDMRPFGIDDPHFPRLYVFGDALWGTHLISGLLFRFDLKTGAPLDPVTLPALSVGTAVGEDGVWVALADGRVVRYTDTAIAEEIPTPIRVERLAVEGELIALLDVRKAEVALLHRTDGTVWTATLKGAATLEGIALMDGRVFVTDRETGEVIALDDGAEVGRVYTGSDTFSLTRDGERMLVVNRQGAALPESGAYEGAPGLITAVDRDLNVLWVSEHDKTNHFVAFDGEKWWTANEDALNLSAVDGETGEVLVRSPPIGLTVDHLSEVDGRYFFGSHLTDEVWRVDFEAASAEAVEVCGWPFVTVLDGESLRVPCQESGEIATVDPEALTVTSVVEVADTFHAGCEEDGLCTGHTRLLDAALDGERLALTDPHTLSVMWEDGSSASVEPDGDQAGVLHMGLVSVEGTLLAYESSERVVRSVVDEVVTGMVSVPSDPFDFPLVSDGAWTWVGSVALDAGLNEVASLPSGVAGAAAGAGWVVGVQGMDFVVYDRETLTEQSRLSMGELRSVPFVLSEEAQGPLRLMVDEVGPSGGVELIVANLFRGTIERRLLPSLEATGTDEVVPVGRWAGLEGLR